MRKQTPLRPNDTKKNGSNILNHTITGFIIILSVVILYFVYSITSKTFFNKELAKESVAAQAIPSKIIQMEVLNGCGVTGIAERFTSYLKTKEFDVVQSGNYISLSCEESMVIDRRGNMANAYRLAEYLGIDKKNVVQQLNNDYLVDVSLVVGKDYFKLNTNKN